MKWSQLRRKIVIMKDLPSVLISTNVSTEFWPTPSASRFIEHIYNYASGKEDVTINLVTPPTVLMGCSYLALARQIQIKKFIESGADFLMMIDADETWAYNTIEKLVKHNLPLVSGLVYSRKYPYYPVWLNYNELDNKLEQNNTHYLPMVPNGLLKVDAIGAGFMLMRRDVALAIGTDAPANLSASECEWGEVGEDIAICYRARQHGFDCYVDLTTEIKHFSYVGIDKNIYYTEKT